MQGQLDYFNNNGQLVSLDLSKGQTVFGPPSNPAILEWQPTKATWTIMSERPQTGLSVNGRHIGPKIRVPLGHLDVISVNSLNARFLRIPEPPQFKFKNCDEVLLGRKKLVVGRAEFEAIADSSKQGEERWNLDHEDRSISKVHVEIQREPTGYVIYDHSKTGTYLNGSVFQSKLLVPGDRFNIGSYFFYFTGTSIRRVDQVSGARVEGRKLIVEVPHDGGLKRILKGVSIEIQAGEFLGVLGGSGQGKSTLMNVLGGLALASKGQVLVDGGSADIQVGFVPQDDIVHKELTVREAITLTARLRLNVASEAIETLVWGILRRLGLENQEHQVIASLSGGQRKRVNIATELLARPPILFLDEPTSGLDPENEESVMATLQNLRLTGQTVVCTTHSLHKVFLFDRIAFIHDGQLMFLGTQDEARSHFLDITEASSSETSGTSVKLDRIYKLLSQNNDAKKWEQKFALSGRAPFRPNAPPPPRRVVAAARPQQRPGFFATLAVLIETQWRILRSDSRNIKSLLLQALGIGTLAGWVGMDDPEFRFFTCLIATLWFGCSNAAQTITRELPVFRRERIAGLGLHSYILSKTLFLSAIAWIQVLLLLLAQTLPVLLGYMGFARTPAGDLFPTSAEGIACFVLAYLLAGVVGVMIGLSLSSHARTTTQASLWVPLVLIPQILFSGFVVTLPEMPMLARLFSYAVPSASAQRLLDAGNIAGKRVPLMTDKTEVPMFYWTDFGDTNAGKAATKLVPLKVPPKLSLDGESTYYRELDEYATAWQNLTINAAKVGKERLPTRMEQYGKDSESSPYLFKRPDVLSEAGSNHQILQEVLLGILSLLGWVVLCYTVIWAGLALAQPETLHPPWARRLKGSKALASSR